MAQKLRTKRDRIVTITAWAFILLIGSLEIAGSHGTPRFLPLLQIAAALIVILSEIKGLIDEPT